MCARYIPASREADIGGDWYDVFPMKEGRFGLVVGDVFGHGITAAAAMAQLRIALRADAVTQSGPAEALEHLNWITSELDPELLATLVFAEFDPASRRVRFARAGHPPPLSVDSRGEARYIEGVAGIPIGVFPHVEYEEADWHLGTGDTLLLFSDGLVERRDEPLGQRLELMRSLASDMAADLDAACAHIISTLLAGGVGDDVALLAVRLASPHDDDDGAELRIGGTAGLTARP